MSRYLVTGATGFLGTALVDRLLGEGHTVVGLARGEYRMLRQHERLEWMSGDVAEQCVVELACRGVEGIFHLAAYKHVRLAESQQIACVRANVAGSFNLAMEAIRREWPTGFCIAISTDKAVQVSGVYGATKYLMEEIWKDAQKHTNCQMRLVRYGNVLWSTGSVLHLWREALKAGEQVIITDSDATRFYWTREQAIDHIFQCLEQDSVEPWVPPMKAMRMGDVLAAMIQLYSPRAPGNVNVKEIGLQPGENLHERLSSSVRSNEVDRYNLIEVKAIIRESEPS